MNEIKTIMSDRNVNNDYFSLIRIKPGSNHYKVCYKSGLRYIKDFLLLFNVEDFYIIKKSGKQRIVSIEELKEFKYSGYTLFKKDKFCIEHIKIWLDFINNDLGCVPYLSKTLPPFSPEKIIIK